MGFAGEYALDKVLGLAHNESWLERITESARA
jgi:hypothetical protein